MVVPTADTFAVKLSISEMLNGRRYTTVLAILFFVCSRG